MAGVGRKRSISIVKYFMVLFSAFSSTLTEKEALCDKGKPQLDITSEFNLARRPRRPLDIPGAFSFRRLMKLIMITVAVILTLCVMVSAQTFTLYFPSGAGTLKAVTIQPGINVITDAAGTIQTPPPIPIIPGILLANETPGIRQQAIDDCMSGKTAPMASAAGIGPPSCTINGNTAVITDALARVKLLLGGINGGPLQYYNLELIQ